MPSTPLQRIQSATSENVALKYAGPYDQYFDGFGQDTIRLLQLHRDGPVHTIRQFEVHTSINGLEGNTAFEVAKTHGIASPEKFAITLARKLLSQYAHIADVRIHVDEYPWQHISEEADDDESEEDDHAYKFAPNSIRYCKVKLSRQDSKPKVISGIKGLHLIKTLFRSFHKEDEYDLIEEPSKKLTIDVCWQFEFQENTNFHEILRLIKNIMRIAFEREPNIDQLVAYSQQTLYLIEKEILERIPEIKIISMSLHYKKQITGDTKPCQRFGQTNKRVRFTHLEEPQCRVYAQLSRKELKTHL